MSKHKGRRSSESSYKPVEIADPSETVESALDFDPSAIMADMDRMREEISTLKSKSEPEAVPKEMLSNRISVRREDAERFIDSERPDTQFFSTMSLSFSIPVFENKSVKNSPNLRSEEDWPLMMASFRRWTGAGADLEYENDNSKYRLTTQYELSTAPLVRIDLEKLFVETADGDLIPWDEAHSGDIPGATFFIEKVELPGGDTREVRLRLPNGAEPKDGAYGLYAAYQRIISSRSYRNMEFVTSERWRLQISGHYRRMWENADKEARDTEALAKFDQREIKRGVPELASA